MSATLPSARAIVPLTPPTTGNPPKSRFTTPTPVEGVPTISLPTPVTGLQWRRTIDQTDMSRPGRGGKMTRGKGGWGNLPPNLLQIIFSYGAQQEELTGRIYEEWQEDSIGSETERLAQASLERVWYCRMRTVAPGWKTAVDSHPFWPKYARILDPSKIDPFFLYDVPSSNRSAFQTPFLRARKATSVICLACRLNNPQIDRLRPVLPPCVTSTARFGFVPTCERHHGDVCSACLRQESSTMDSHGSSTYEGLWLATQRDTDEFGRFRIHGQVCTACRDGGIEFQVKKLLQECARGGLARYNEASWATNLAWEEYRDSGRGTAAQAAYAAVEEQWLVQEGRFSELVQSARILQARMKWLKMKYHLTGKGETLWEKHHRVSLTAEIRGVSDLDEIGNDDAIMASYYRLWAREPVLDREFYDFDPRAEDDQPLEDDIRHMLIEGCINDWIQDRVRFGFWVSPIDEVHQITRRGDISRHYPFSLLAHQSTHPFAATVGVDAISAAEQSLGVIHQKAGPTSILPPGPLLDRLHIAFANALADRLRPAMQELVAYHRVELGSDDRAESVLAGWSAEMLLTHLGMEIMWVNGGPLALRYQFKTEHSARPDHATRNATIVRRDQEGKSPVIEVVDEDSDEPDYGIHISDVEEDEELVEYTEVEEDDQSVGESYSESSDGWVISKPAAEGLTPPIELLHPDEVPASVSQVADTQGHYQDKVTERTQPVESPDSAKRKIPPESIQAIEPRKRAYTSSPPSAAVSDDKSSSDMSSVPALLTPNATPPKSSIQVPDEDVKHIQGSNDVVPEPKSQPDTIQTLLETLGTHFPIDEIPFVPHIAETGIPELGPLAVKILMETWHEARASLRECKCGICLRDRERGRGTMTAEEMMGLLAARAVGRFR